MTNAAAPMTDQQEIKARLQRQVAAKIVSFLPPEDADALHILDLAAGLVEGFTSSAAIRSGGLFLMPEEEASAEA